MRPPDILDDLEFEDLPDWSEEGEVVAKFYSTLEAEMAAARLRSEGIHCFLANAIAPAVTPHLQHVIRLHTHSDDADLAREILREAAIETDAPLVRKDSGLGAVIILAIIIGLVLAWFLVQAVGWYEG